MPTEEPTAMPAVEAAAVVTPTVEAAEAVTVTVETATEASAESQPAATTSTEQASLVVPASPKTSISDNLVFNGSFEEGFDEQGVAQGWTAFTTSAENAVYAWGDDTDDQHVSHGEHAQRMRIMGPGEIDQVMGLYQTVEVVPGEVYTLSLHGLIRASTYRKNNNLFAFRLQYAVVDGDAVDWRSIGYDDWTDPGWNDVALDARWPEINAYTVPITAQSDKVTLYIRGWSKWALFQSEASFYVDGVFLKGPDPSGEAIAAPAVSAQAVEAPAVGQIELPTTGGDMTGLIAIVGAVLILGMALWEMRKGRLR
jgi:LPXTG-motif cell wall-anchored protein